MKKQTFLGMGFVLAGILTGYFSIGSGIALPWGSWDTSAILVLAGIGLILTYMEPPRRGLIRSGIELWRGANGKGKSLLLILFFLPAFFIGCQSVQPTGINYSPISYNETLAQAEEARADLKTAGLDPAVAQRYDSQIRNLSASLQAAMADRESDRAVIAGMDETNQNLSEKIENLQTQYNTESARANQFRGILWFIVAAIALWVIYQLYKIYRSLNGINPLDLIRGSLSRSGRKSEV